MGFNPQNIPPPYQVAIDAMWRMADQDQNDEMSYKEFVKHSGYY